VCDGWTDGIAVASTELAMRALRARARCKKLCIISTAFDVTEGIFAVLYVSIMGLTRSYKMTVFYMYKPVVPKVI